LAFCGSSNVHKTLKTKKTFLCCLKYYAKNDLAYMSGNFSGINNDGCKLVFSIFFSRP